MHCNVCRKGKAMKVINYFESDRQEALIQALAGADWSAARFLVKLLREGTFFETLGGEGSLFFLMDGEMPLSFATLTRQDSIRDESMQPWIGFVYTWPEYRGHRYAGRVLAHAEQAAAAQGCQRVYIATDHVGLYEKYGYTYLENRIDCWGDDERILYKDI